MSKTDKEPKAARRRRDKLRIKKRAKRVFPEFARTQYIGDNLRYCSCKLCGNGKHFGILKIADKRILQEGIRKILREEGFMLRPAV